MILEILSIKFETVVAWYDLWIGAYWDRKNEWLYILPVPCLGVRIKGSPKAALEHLLEVLLLLKVGVWVYEMNEYDWVAARSADEALADYMKTTGLPRGEALDCGMENARPLTFGEMSRLQFTYDFGGPGYQAPFRKRLVEMVLADEKFPMFFASTEF